MKVIDFYIQQEHDQDIEGIIMYRDVQTYLKQLKKKKPKNNRKHENMVGEDLTIIPNLDMK